MATLTVKCRRGDATVEVQPDETAEQAAARLNEAVEAAGGRLEPKGPKQPKPKLMTVEEMRSREMQRFNMLECTNCRTWVPATKASAQHHQQKCAAKAVA